MAYSYAITTADGTSDLVSVPFQYLKRAHVSVSLGGSTVEAGTLTWLSDGQIQLAEPPTVSTQVRVYRTTPINQPLVDFLRGSYDARDLNNLARQLLFVCQETLDSVVDANEIADTALGYLDDMEELHEQITSLLAQAEAILAASNQLGTPADGSVTLSSLSSDVEDLLSGLGGWVGAVEARLEKTANLGDVDDPEAALENLGGAKAGSLPRGAIYGLSTASAADQDHDITVQAGSCASEAATGEIVVTGPITKQFDAAFAVGTNQGGMALGESLPVSGTIHIWAIAKADGTSDVMANNNASSGLNPTLPAGFVTKRRIASRSTDASANIRPMLQWGDEFVFKEVLGVIRVLNPGTAEITRTLPVPNGIRVLAHLNVALQWLSTGVGRHVFYSPDATDNGASAGPIITGASGGNWASAQGLRLLTNTAGQIKEKHSTSATNDTVDIGLAGWVDTRGRAG